MKHSSFKAVARLLRTVAAVTVTLVAFSTPAHAQFGSLFQSIMQQTMDTQQAAAQKAATEAATAQPSKTWGPVTPVTPDVQATATAFAVKTNLPELRPLFERLYIEGERNATLNLQRIGMAALAMGKVDVAEKAFEGAVYRIDLIYADNAEAQKAKSLWTAEKVKDYKGEPYERAMAFFYRGLVYAAKGDFQNARAMFKQADYQDTVAEAEQYAGDFGLMPYMAGWASYCDGNVDMAKDFLQQAIKGDKNYTSVSVEQPLLVLFESGRAPFKYGGGKAGEVLMWQPFKQPTQIAKSACLDVGGASCSISSFVRGADIGFQATTRGGRPIDGVMDGKANFKEGAQTVVTVANTVGQVGMQTAMMTGNRDAGSLGLLGMFAGLAAQGMANATQVQADIREWEQLPGIVWLGTGATKEAVASLKVAEDTAGKVSYANASRLVDSPRCQLYWGRSLAPMSLLRDAGPLEPGQHKRDPVFRQEIADSFAAD